jgi:UDP-N-acetyl-D-glucosamine dehydrogenase
MRLAVIGQGYVGLSISVAAVEVGHEVVGVDLSKKVVDLLRSGGSHIEGIDAAKVKAGVTEGKFRPTTDYSDIGDCEAVIIAVPTPIRESKSPDLSPLESASNQVGQSIKRKTLIINESTSFPGTLRSVIKPIIDRESGLEHLYAISPERVDPGNQHFAVKNTPRLVGGIDAESLEAAVNLYRTFCDDVVAVSSPEVAEAAKLLENTFRFVNIGFIDEFSKIMNAMKIPVEEVIRAASTKPYGFMPFYPNIGIGGHCIPVDPHYLQQEAVKHGVTGEYIKLTSKINDAMPGHLISSLEKKLGGLSKKKCLVIGVTYKPNIADTRETPAYEVVDQLSRRGVNVKWHDPLVNGWRGEESSSVTGDYDFALVLAAHDAIDLKGWSGAPIFSVRSNLRHPEWISLIDLGSEV